MRVYAKCLGAYLTGWLIVQPLYNRLYAAWRRRELANPSGEWRAHLRQQADEIVDVMEERGHLVRPAQRPMTGPLATPHPGYERDERGYPTLRKEPVSDG